VKTADLIEIQFAMLTRVGTGNVYYMGCRCAHENGHFRGDWPIELKSIATTHSKTVLWPFLQDHPGEPVPENFWTLWCKGRLTEADTQTIHLGATPSGLTSAHLHHPPIFYMPDALSAAQPTVSNH